MSNLLAVYTVEGILLILLDVVKGVVFFNAIFVPRFLIWITSPILSVNLHG